MAHACESGRARVPSAHPFKAHPAPPIVCVDICGLQSPPCTPNCVCGHLWPSKPTLHPQLCGWTSVALQSPPCTPNCVCGHLWPSKPTLHPRLCVWTSVAFKAHPAPPIVCVDICGPSKPTLHPQLCVWTSVALPACMSQCGREQSRLPANQCASALTRLRPRMLPQNSSDKPQSCEPNALAQGLCLSKQASSCTS